MAKPDFDPTLRTDGTHHAFFTGGGMVVPTDITAGGRNLVIDATADFLPTDPWSTGFRSVLSAEAPRFSGKHLIEFGFGDGRNPLTIIHSLDGQRLPPPTHIVGIEKDEWR